MRRVSKLPIPVMRALRQLGRDINNARRRRRITAQLMAERAGISRATVSKIEKGEPGVSVGAYAAVLFVLGMVQRLGALADASHDLTGRELQDEELPTRVCYPRERKKRDDKDE